MLGERLGHHVDDPWLPGPFAAAAPGCGGDPRAGQGHCQVEPTRSGVFYDPFPRPGAIWLGFACDRHAYQLVAAGPILPRHRAVLVARRESLRSGSLCREGPLATGRAARELLGRARMWAAKQVTSR